MAVHDEWLSQAERDLTAAELLQTGNLHEWAAYAAQQSAEKAAKAVRLALGMDEGTRDFRIHEAATLLRCLPDQAPHPVLPKLGVLDAHNQNARYPGLTGTGTLAPHKVYTAQMAQEALDLARATLAYSKGLVPLAEKFWTARKPPSSTP